MDDRESLRLEHAQLRWDAYIEQIANDVRLLMGLTSNLRTILCQVADQLENDDRQEFGSDLEASDILRAASILKNNFASMIEEIDGHIQHATEGALELPVMVGLHAYG